MTDSIEFIELKDTMPGATLKSSVRSHPIGMRHVINLNREITSSSDFQEELDIIRNAQPEDIIHIYFACDGGDLNTTLELANALSNTPALIICELSSHAYSGGSMLLMLGDEFIINANTSVMIHTASYGLSGNEPTIKNHVEFFNKQMGKIINDFYSEFLLESEIEEVLNGRELWFTAEETHERIEMMMEAKQEQAMNQQQQNEEVICENLGCGDADCKNTGFEN